MNKLYFTKQEHNVFNTPKDDSANAVSLRKSIHKKFLELNMELQKNNFMSDFYINYNSRHKTTEYVFTSRTKSIQFMSLRYWNKKFMDSFSKKRELYYYPHIEIKVNQNGVFIGLYVGNYNKENTSGIKRNWFDIDRQLNELKEQGYFWEYDNAKEHYFSWITDLSHESVLLKRLDYSSNNYEMDSDDYGIDIDDIKKEIMTLYSLLKKLSS